MKRQLNSTEVIDALTDLFILRGVPAYIRSDNGPALIAVPVKDGITADRAKTAYIEPGSPWEHGYCENFNGRMRNELLNGKLFYSLSEARKIIERWRNNYNTKQPYSALRYSSPTPKVNHTDRPKANHAIIFNLDHSSRADQGHASQAITNSVKSKCIYKLDPTLGLDKPCQRPISKNFSKAVSPADFGPRPSQFKPFIDGKLEG